MKTITTLLILNFISIIALAQTDSLPTSKPELKLEKIASSRRELLASFLLEDQAGAGHWMDSLSRLEDENYAGLIWDERWLLYYWTESYGTLLEEVSLFDRNQRNLQAWKIQAPRDSLFEWVDITMNERRFEAFSSIRKAFLNEEEKAFTTLLLEYLLRLNTNEEEWAERLQTFENRYPASQFLGFIRSVKPNLLKPSKQAFGMSGGLLVGNWRGDIERTLGTPYMLNLDFYFWTKRWNFLFDCSIGGPSLSRDLFVGNEVWPKADPTSFFTIGLGMGYDIVNTPKLRIFPSIGGGVGILKPPTPDEDEDPLPEYYDDFNFSEFHFAGAVNADIKLFTKNYKNWNLPKGSYHGIRLKFGWNGLDFGKKNDDLQGDLIYFAVNYNFFAYLAK
ncbi:MAG: hypothetical protein Q7T20_09395 [Saprospiraceae bacterium]|nr:hypothetical protein [Saprospiraceae bacterium]